MLLGLFTYIVQWAVTATKIAVDSVCVDAAQVQLQVSPPNKKHLQRFIHNLLVSFLVFGALSHWYTYLYVRFVVYLPVLWNPIQQHQCIYIHICVFSCTIMQNRCVWAPGKASQSSQGTLHRPVMLVSSPLQLCSSSFGYNPEGSMQPLAYPSHPSIPYWADSIIRSILFTPWCHSMLYIRCQSISGRNFIIANLQHAHIHVVTIVWHFRFYLSYLSTKLAVSSIRRNSTRKADAARVA